MVQYPLAGIAGTATAEVRVVDPSETYDIGDGVQRPKGITLAQLVQVAKGQYTLTFPHDLTGETVTMDFSHLREMDPQTRVTVRCAFRPYDRLDPAYQIWGRQAFAGRAGRT